MSLKIKEFLDNPALLRIWNNALESIEQQQTVGNVTPAKMQANDLAVKAASKAIQGYTADGANLLGFLSRASKGEYSRKVLVDAGVIPESKLKDKE